MGKKHASKSGKVISITLWEQLKWQTSQMKTTLLNFSSVIKLQNNIKICSLSLQNWMGYKGNANVAHKQEYRHFRVYF